ncbi:uncharacterized protein LOC135138695 [Zophobas morio]|uniref:uncharacterized protein LOC135138695 n=1 Tax=Zophobas morio TaxID=2755281 RepID=UPI00308374A4
MKPTIVSVCILTVLSFSSCAELPPSFEKCNIKHLDFEKCLSDAIHDAIKQLKDPIPELGLPSIDPFNMKSIKLDLGDSTQSLQQIWSNITVQGLSKPAATDARWTSGSIITLDLDVRYDHTLVFTTDYEAHGAALLLVVDIFSKFTCDFVGGGNVKVTYKIQQPEKSSGYFELISTKVVLEPKQVKFMYHDFFQNQSMTDAINSEINKNWKATWDFVHEFVGVYDPYFGALLRSILERVPADQIFDGLS